MGYYRRIIGFTENILAGGMLDLPIIALHIRIRWYEGCLKLGAKEDVRVRLLRTLPSVGAVTASAVIAGIGDGYQFRNGREQHSQKFLFNIKRLLSVPGKTTGGSGAWGGRT